MGVIGIESQLLQIQTGERSRDTSFELDIAPQLQRKPDPLPDVDLFLAGLQGAAGALQTTLSGVAARSIGLLALVSDMVELFFALLPRQQTYELIVVGLDPLAETVPITHTRTKAAK